MEFTYFGKAKPDEDYYQQKLNNNSRQNKFTIIDGERFLQENCVKQNWIPRNVLNLSQFNVNIHDTLLYNVYVTESDGPYREFLKIRPMKLLYHFDDSSFTLVEPKTENSGYLGGQLFRRKQVPSKNVLANRFLSWKDFNIGDDVNLFGTYYHVASCDQFTRNFLTSNEINVNPNEAIPYDSWNLSRIEKKNIDTTTPKFNFNHFHLIPRQMILNLAWLDTNNDYSTRKLKRTFKLIIDTSDDTVTMIEKTPGYGDQLFLKGVRLIYHTSDGVQRYYRAGNLYPGMWIEVYKRPMFIYDAEGDDTIKYLKQNFGKIDFGNCPVDILEKGPPPKHFDISLNELVFEAHTNSLRDFNFLLIYSSNEKVVNVFEESKRHKWRKGRPFLEEVDVSDLSPQDFDLKKEIKLYKWKFVLEDASPITKEYLKFRSL
uniref:DKNYY family protein n=1 Tax=Parastrongyloides trichosuri TaxID=131310 RepID=A0A0N4ZJX6_PARTI